MKGPRYRCIECDGQAAHACRRCGKPRCWLHLTARAAPGKAGLFHLVCRGECRLRRRARCAAMSPTDNRCRLQAGHDGPHQLRGWWMWEDGADGYLAAPVSRGAADK